MLNVRRVAALLFVTVAVLAAAGSAGAAVSAGFSHPSGMSDGNGG